MAGALVVIEELGHPPGIDRGDHSIEQRGDVDDKDENQDLGLDEEAGQLQAVDPKEDSSQQRHQQDRPGCEGESSVPGTGVRVAEAGKEE